MKSLYLLRVLLCVENQVPVQKIRVKEKGERGREKEKKSEKERKEKRKKVR